MRVTRLLRERPTDLARCVLGLGRVSRNACDEQKSGWRTPMESESHSFTFDRWVFTRGLVSAHAR